MGRTRNVFISFHVADEAQVNLLRAQGKSERFDLEFRDFSVKEPFDSAWKQQCRDRIAQTSITICMIGEKTHEREAVAWELETSYELGHKTIGVRIYRDSNHTVPATLLVRGAPIIDWDLVAVIRELESLSVRCGATTKVTRRACQNRVLGRPPCWQHTVAQVATTNPPEATAGPFELLKDLLQRLSEKQQ